MRTLSSIGLVATRNQPFVRIGFCLVFARLLESARCVEAIVMTTVQPIPVIAGPTAGGKTSLAVEVALRAATGGEIVSADSIQIFRDGHRVRETDRRRAGGRPPPPDRCRRSPRAGSPFTVDDWLRRAAEARAGHPGAAALPDRRGRDQPLHQGLPRGAVRGARARRRSCAAIAVDPPGRDRRAELERVDPAAAERIHPNDDGAPCARSRSTARPACRSPSTSDSGTGSARADDARLFGLDLADRADQPAHQRGV
jgi:hypothetical protein